ncbi:hypothetical protein [Actinosynnema sp. ALI-1.44]|uniref:hypothetical protein n=1 Tax=Actinosynnema sp. ALI-1.44 TaxID=1933779 RepID=UPI0011789EAB|nr:hypothetical protein [Actinosynnema sp. ALI-1.44]
MSVLTGCDSEPEHRLGEAVDVRVQALSTKGGQSTRGMVGFAVLEVRRGDPAGLAGTSRAGTGTPYEVVSSLTNKTDVALSVSIGLHGIDTAGNRLTDFYGEEIYFRLPAPHPDVGVRGDTCAAVVPRCRGASRAAPALRNRRR